MDPIHSMFCMDSPSCISRSGSRLRLLLVVQDELHRTRQCGNLPFNSSFHFLTSSFRLVLFVFCKFFLMSGWLFSSASKFLHDIKSSHWLQLNTFFSLAHMRMVQEGLPPPFRHPLHRETFCREANPFMNSSKSKSLGAHFSN